MTRSEYLTGAVLTLILIMAVPMAVYGIPDKGSGRDTAGYGRATSHSPVSIRGNDGFDYIVNMEGWSGSGTDQNPYIIKGLNINTAGYEYGIIIKDTSRIFSIENCRITGPDDASNKFGYGIYIGNVNMFTISGCILDGPFISGIYVEPNYGELSSRIYFNEIQGSSNGIAINGAANIVVDENRIHDNSIGISSIGAQSCYIYENEIRDNSQDGILIIGTYQGGISRNLIMNNGRFGLMSRDSYHNLIFENSFIANNGADEDFDPDHIQAADHYKEVSSRNIWKSQYGKGNHWRDWLYEGFQDGVKPYTLHGEKTYDDAPLRESAIKAPPSSIMNFTCTMKYTYIDLEWKKPFDAGSSGITGYAIRRKVENSMSVNNTILLGADYNFYHDEEIDTDGVYTYTVKAVNDKGEGSESDSLSVMIDRTDPIVEIISPEEGSELDNNSVEVKWKAVDRLSGINRTFITMNDGPWMDAGTDTSYEFILVETGVYRFRVRVFDRSGNNNTAVVNFTYDGLPPKITVKWNYNGTIINRSFVYIDYFAVDELSEQINYSIKIDGDPWIQIGDSRSIRLEDLADGDHTLRISASDTTGNTAEKTLYFIIDTTEPLVEIISPVHESLCRSTGGISVQWDSHDLASGIWNNSVRIDGGPWIDVRQKELYSFSYPGEGYHMVDVMVYDCAGHLKISSVSFVVDLEFPRVFDSIPGKKMVGPDTCVSVIFSEPMDPGRTRISVAGIGGRSVWNGMTLSYEPYGLYVVGITYRVDVYGYDMASNRLDPFTWTFTVLPFSCIGESLVAGNILDEYGIPIDNASVYLDGYNVDTTDLIGGFHFTTAGGVHNILITKDGVTIYNQSFNVEDNTTKRLGNIIIVGEEDGGSDRYGPVKNIAIIIVVVTFLTSLLITISVIRYYRNRSDFEVVILDGDRIEIDGEIYREPELTTKDEDNLKVMFDRKERPLTPDAVNIKYSHITAEDLYGPDYADYRPEEAVHQEVPDMMNDQYFPDDIDDELETWDEYQSDLDLTILNDLDDLRVDPKFTWRDLANPLYERSNGREVKMDDLDCYEILGISPYSTRKEIKLAYRKLARDYHPDRISSHDRTLKDIAGEEMKKLNYAKETLLDPDRRTAHDMMLDIKRKRSKAF